MPRILLTAFGPYNDWDENASWLALQSFLADLPDGLDVTTRLYPVDFTEVRSRLAKDLADRFDVALHLGQAPGYGGVELESFGINVGCERRSAAAFPLTNDGPPAYQSQLPLTAWSALLRDAGIPASVSFHAGTYLCNAALYMTHYFSERQGYPTKAAFLHLPLDTSQAINGGQSMASLPSSESARAIRLIVDQIQNEPALSSSANVSTTE